jgi:membrane protein DedA with SNARE-associated domain
MTFGLRTILLLVAVVLFIIGIFAEEHYADILTLGLAAFAGAFLSDALGWADRTFGSPADRNTT